MDSKTMKKILGIICGLMALLLFAGAMMVEGPGAGQPMSYNFGYFIGSHGPWVGFAVGAYFLLKKRD
tara:strand:+ start:367 stop:567 length:201 start_codon:yes stop_codon:yes gene_type:complete